MADNSEVLANGFGMPYVWIFDSKDNIVYIKDEWGDDKPLNSFIENFKYRYDEENDDECTIKIGLIKVEQLNSPYFKEDVVLKVQWGYILPQGEILKSAKRTIAIRYVNPDYKTTGIELELIGTDLVSYLKNIRTNKTSDTDLLELYIAEIIGGQFIATKTIKGKTKVINRYSGKVAQGQIAIGTNASDQFKTVPEYRSEVQSENKIDTTHAEIAGTLGYNDNIIIKENDLVIKGKSKVITQAIEERLNEEPDGPLYLEGRDNVLNIIKRDFTQPVYKQYTYRGGSGELMDFKANTNEVICRDDEAENNFVNPVTKKVETSRTGHAVEHEGEYAELGLPEGITKLDVLKWYAAFEEAAKQNLKGENILNQNDLNFATFKKMRTAPRGHYGNANNMGSTRVAKGPEVFGYNMTIPTKVLLSSPLINRVRRERILENYMMKKIEKKYEARVKVMGDPSLISSRIYDFLNLSNIDKGKWYAISVEHEINVGQGYLCMMDMVRKPKIIGRIMDRREYPYEDKAGGKQEFDKKEIEYITEKGSNFNRLSSGLEYDDINNRLIQQAVVETYYQSGNDIIFNTKKDVNFDKNIINSSES